MAIIRSVGKRELLQQYSNLFQSFIIVQVLFNVKYVSAFNLFLKPWKKNVIASVENVTICLILADEVILLCN